MTFISSDDEEVVDLTSVPVSVGAPAEKYKAATAAAQNGFKKPAATSSAQSYARFRSSAANVNRETPIPVKTEKGVPTTPADRAAPPSPNSAENASSGAKKPMPFQMYGEKLPKKEAKPSPSPSPSPMGESEEAGNHFNERMQYGDIDDAEAGDDVGGYCEIFNEYKCNSITYGVQHPGHIVEGCVLASVRLPPPVYPLREALPAEIITGGKLSQLQLEGVLYACQRHLVMLPWRMPLRFDAPVIQPECFIQGQGPAAKAPNPAPAADGPVKPEVKSEAGDDDDDAAEEITKDDKKDIEKTIAKVEKVTAGLTERSDKTVMLANGECVTTAGFTRAAFFIGDGAGVGKGRQIAGIIAANYARGRTKAVWVSTSADLRMDAERDLRDLGCPIKVINGCKDLSAYTMANGEVRRDYRQGVLFVTYHTLSRPDRMCEILKWCGGVNYEGVLVFDESHKAKNLDMGVGEKSNKGSKMSVAVLTLQRAMPLSRVVYCSATGVTDLQHLAFMERLGLWGPGTAFDNFYSFHKDIKSRGIGALEMVSMSLKENGVYVSRGLSFQNCQFDVVYANVDDKMQKCYDECADFWRQLLVGLKNATHHLPTIRKKTVFAQYWGTAQRFFLQLSIASKVKTVVRVATQALDDGHCVVIGLQATGEAALDYAELSAAGERDDFVSHTRESLRKYIDKFFPDCEMVPDLATPGVMREHVHYPSRLAKEALLKRLDNMELPPTPLDHIIDELGGPEIVAEMTGRRGRLVRNYRNKVVLEYRGQGEGDIENLNIRETERFQRGERLVAVISDAASTGISLHASSRVMNQKRRIHITLELPWAADKAIQQLGRSHRTDQVSAPYYKLVVSDLPGERRCAVSVSARLESLGALTRGDRRAAHAMDLSSFNLDTKYGKEALELVLNSVLAEKELLKDVDQKALEKNFNDAFEGTMAYSAFNYLDALKECLRYMDSIENPLEVLGDPDKAYREYMRIKKKNKKMKIKTFLNRLLMMPVKYQHLFYGYFILAFDYVIAKAKREGRYNEGIADISGSKVELVRTNELYQHTSGLVTKHLSIQTDRGMSFEAALKYLEDNGSAQLPPGCRDGLPDGFYITRDRDNVVGNKEYILLAIRRKDKIRHFDIWRPNTGRAKDTMETHNLEYKYRPVKPEQMKAKWTTKYNASATICDHGNGCSKGRGCDHGKRIVKYEVVTGGLLPLWHDIDVAFSLFQGEDKKTAKVVRVAFENGTRAVGLELPTRIINMLEDDWKAKMESSWRIESDAVYQESETPVCEEAYNALATGQAPKPHKRKSHTHRGDDNGDDPTPIAKRKA